MDREPDWTWWDETRAIARRHARGASDAADDLAQELALAALERGAVAPARGAVGPEHAVVARPGAWLERVGRNHVIDGWRVERRRRELAGAIEAPVAPPDPETRVLLRERRGLLRRALAALPRPLRRAALARFHADLPFDAVASRLGTEPVTARTRVHRALERLRARVGGLRAFFVWLPGAQATLLGVTLMTGVARPVLFPVAFAPAPAARVLAPSTHARHIAQAPAPVARPAPAAASTPRAAPARVTAHAPRAEEPPPPAPPAVQRYSYDDDEIPGELELPQSDHVWGDPVTSQPSLVELRWNFVPELLKTLDDI